MFTICFFIVVFVISFVGVGLALADSMDGTVKKIVARVKDAICAGYLRRNGLVAVPEEAPRMAQRDVDIMMALISNQ